MLKVNIGGFPFNIPQNWGEVTYSQAQELFTTKPEDLRQRLRILGGIPETISNSEELTAGQVIALYEIISFIEDVPELVGNEVEVPLFKHWTFLQYEHCRKAVSKHPSEITLSFSRICEVLELPTEHYLEVGAKAVDILINYITSWGDYMKQEEPTDKELAAGIERLQVFGAYSILQDVGKSYGKLPTEIEKEPAAWVLTEWIYTMEKGQYINNYQELNRPKV